MGREAAASLLFYKEQGMLQGLLHLASALLFMLLSGAAALGALSP